MARVGERRYGGVAAWRGAGGLRLPLWLWWLSVVVHVAAVAAWRLCDCSCAACGLLGTARGERSLDVLTRQLSRLFDVMDVHTPMPAHMASHAMPPGEPSCRQPQ